MLDDEALSECDTIDIIVIIIAGLVTERDRYTPFFGQISLFLFK